MECPILTSDSHHRQDDIMVGIILLAKVGREMIMKAAYGILLHVTYPFASQNWYIQDSLPYVEPIFTAWKAAILKYHLVVGGQHVILSYEIPVPPSLYVDVRAIERQDQRQKISLHSRQELITTSIAKRGDLTPSLRRAVVLSLDYFLRKSRIFQCLTDDRSTLLA
jgi:hypothetical protein